MTTSLLLDTHAWIWAAGGDRRIAKLIRRLERAAEDRSLLLSTMSVHEAAVIGLETQRGVRRGRRAVAMRPSVKQWIHETIILTRVVVVPLDVDIAVDGAELQAMHADPFDRLIVAAAMHANAALVTADVKILEFAARAGVSVLAL